MENLLLHEPKYKLKETKAGTWKRFLYSSGSSYSEFVSRKQIFGVPLLHYTSGVCPETGKRRVATGVIAIGRVAFGFCAIGQAAFGAIAIGQAALGLLLGLGQLSSGLAAVGQLAIGGIAIGQIAIGVATIGQFGVGLYVLAQQGFGAHVWDMKHVDPVAKGFFRQFLFRR